MSDFLDEELASRGRARMERHLGQCDECRRLLRGLRRTVDLLHRLPAPSEGVDAGELAAAVRGRLGQSD